MSKYCVDCKYFSEGLNNAVYHVHEPDRCGWYKSEFKGYRESPVYGRYEVWKYGKIVTAEGARSYWGGHCGPEGKHWEPKEAVKAATNVAFELTG